MLSRWAKLMGPGKSAQDSNTAEHILPTQKPFWDPSAKGTPASKYAFGAGLAPPPRWATSTDPPRVEALHIRETADPDIPAAVAALKAKLLMQPGLNLDIVGILSLLGQRFEQVHRETAEAVVGRQRNGDVWALCAKKILITQAKLSKWAEIISAREANPGNGGGENGFGIARGGDPRTTGFAGDVDMEGVVDGGVLMNLGGGGAANAEQGTDDWQFNNIWTNDLFDQLDPSMWLDDGSWGTAQCSQWSSGELNQGRLSLLQNHGNI